MASDTLRLFVAIELPDQTRRALVAVIQDLQRDLQGSFRWSAPDSLHLTLKFLGDVERARVPALTKALWEAAASASSHRLSLDGTGTFPGRGSPRVLWVGVGGEVDALLALQGVVERALVAAGEAPEDRRFSPHLTLARVRDPLSPAATSELRTRLEQVRFNEEAAFYVREVALVHSTLRPHGAVYRTLFRGPLPDARLG
jgi:RNA 2',3'-cyclic 3'-phosphodiesterase